MCSSGEKQFIPPGSPLGHEIRHAFDVILGRKFVQQDFDEKDSFYPHISHSPHFTDAYNSDLSYFKSHYWRMAISEKAMRYYTHSDKIGQAELFAGMFPLLYGRGGGNDPWRTQRLVELQEVFPTVLRFMRDHADVKE